MDLSVITATRCRPAALMHCLEQFRRQALQGIACEHLVVGDGPDPQARFLAGRVGARYLELPEPGGCAGAFAKDHGVQQARGRYVCFWDDDNLYELNALSVLFAAAQNADIGVVRTGHRLRKGTGVVTIPRHWQGVFRAGDIDTMCVCVRRELAILEPWGDGDARPGTDWRWLKRLQLHSPTIRFVPVIIGVHA